VRGPGRGGSVVAITAAGRGEVGADDENQLPRRDHDPLRRQSEPAQFAGGPVVSIEMRVGHSRRHVDDENATWSTRSCQGECARLVDRLMVAERYARSCPQPALTGELARAGGYAGAPARRVVRPVASAVAIAANVLIDCTPCVRGPNVVT
jgi:hypothetical protein